MKVHSTLNKSEVKIFNDEGNTVAITLLAKELSLHYKSNPDLINSMTLYQLKGVTDILDKIVSQVICRCAFVDCFYESTIDLLLNHMFVCTKNPYYKQPSSEVAIEKSEPLKEKYNKLKEKFEELSEIKPFQVDYYESLKESYLTENRYIESMSTINLQGFMELKSADDWTLIEDISPFRTYMREEEGFTCIKSTILINSHIKKVFTFIDKPENYLKFNKFGVESYSIRQINTTTRLFYLKIKPGFGYAEFIGIQQIFMKGSNTILLLRNSLNEDESPHKYIHQKQPFIDVHKGFIHCEAYIFTFLDEFTTSIEYFNVIDYKLNSEYSEILHGLNKYNLNLVKNIKIELEKET